MQISLLKRNVAANFFGRGFAALLSLVAIPIYIRFLGIEAYGIIGFFTSLTALGIAPPAHGHEPVGALYALQFAEAM